MSNKRTPPAINGRAVDLAGSAQQALAERQLRAEMTSEFTDALDKARGIDPAAVAKRLPTGHVLLPSFPDGDLVLFDPRAVVHIEPTKPNPGVIDLSKLGEGVPELCAVNYQYGIHQVIGSVEQIAGLLFGDAAKDFA